jgi:hypothetical protein
MLDLSSYFHKQALKVNTWTPKGDKKGGSENKMIKDKYNLKMAALKTILH